MTWGANGLSVYIDGALLAQNKTCLELWDTRDLFWGYQPLIIGGSYIPSPSSQPLVGFEGSIARFAIIKDQLTDTEIADLAAVQPDERTVTLVEQSWAQVYE